MSSKYIYENNCIQRYAKDGIDQLTNFTAKIETEQVYHDGDKTTTLLTLSGVLQSDTPEGTPLPLITISASDFAALGWVADRWGMAPIIFPAPSGERDLRTAIQLASKPTKEHIYTHTGWDQVGGVRTYLSSAGGINAMGADPSIKVQLPPELRLYSLPPPTRDKDRFLNSLRLVNIGPKAVMWPMLLATYRAACGPADFALHLAGRTGTYKSEIVSLMQSHYGDGMDARHLPASWSSTTNALESLAYRAKDALMVVDDFVPLGTSYQVRQLQASADRIIRGQGNQAGRARLTEVSSMQVTFYPRGLILSTGEDIPEGHSMRGRMLIIELAPSDIDLQGLTIAQNQRADLAAAMADWIQWIADPAKCSELRDLARQYRDENLGIGHSRTPSIIGDLAATAEMIFAFAADRKYLTYRQAKDLKQKAWLSIIEAASHQTEFLEESDPVKALLETIRNLMTSLLAHGKTRNGGIPIDAERFGWVKEEVPGAMPSYTAKGPILGWIDHEAGEFMLDPGTLTLLKRHSGGKLAVTTQTLLKRLKEAKLLVRTDDARQRNTVRMTIEGHPRQVLVLAITDIMGDE